MAQLNEYPDYSNGPQYPRMGGYGMDSSSASQNTGGFPWGQMLGAGLAGASSFFGQGNDDVTKTINSPMNPFAKNASKNMQDIANVGKGLTIGGPGGAEANYFNSILPMLVAQGMGMNQANMGNLQNIAQMGPQGYLPQEVGFMQQLRQQGPQAFYPGAQFDQANQALQGLAPAARNNLANQLQQQYGNLSGPTAHGRRSELTQEAGSQLEAQLAGMQQQQGNTQAAAMQQAQLAQPALMNSIAGYQQNANQLAPTMAMQAMQGQQGLQNMMPFYGKMLGMGTDTYMNRLGQAQNLYSPLMGLKGTQTTIDEPGKEGAPWWQGMLGQAGNALLNSGGGGGSGWGNIFDTIGGAAKDIFSWF